MRPGQAFSILPLLLLAACSTVLITGRRQFTLLSEEQEIRLGEKSYPEALADYPEVRTGPEVARLRGVLRRLLPYTGKSWEWEVRLLEADDVVNAWCLPGGKMAFYTGILKICRNEDQIAAVMGHEIAHALARHGNERISRSIGFRAFGDLLQAFLGGRDPGRAATRTKVMTAYGAVTKLGFVLPHSRTQESEADEIGLHLMVQAGYDPREAVRLWEKMARLSGARSPLDLFLSTHPAPEARARRLRALIPSVLARYGRAGG